MADEDYTPGEMRRGLERVERSLEGLAKKLDVKYEELRREMQAQSYVPFRTFEAEQKRVDGIMAGFDSRLANQGKAAWQSLGLVIAALGLFFGALKVFGL